jgi:flavin reductase (DIM6/NTAB) family NADH-FMN oxidoreductase RutF
VNDAEGPTVDVADFRAAMRMIVGNVSVITAGVGDDRTGLVVISLVSLSANPPKVIACVNSASSTWPVIERYRHFGVSSLAAGHQKVAERFSGFGGIKGPDRYAGAEFDCRLDEMIDCGSHSIIIGTVAAVRANDIGEAMLYWRGAYRPTRFQD